jgi:ABC-type transporter Mla maintaining outer membrane lipid asymmetry ATPase subunit MlaF
LFQLICFDSPLQGLDPNGVTAVSHNCRNIAAFVIEITAVITPEACP